MNIYHYAFTVLLFAVTANTWVHFLTQGGDLFDWFPTLIQKMSMNEKLHKITFACEKCIAGQMSFWAYTFNFAFRPSYDLSIHFSIVIFSIFTAGIISLIIKKLSY